MNRFFSTLLASLGVFGAMAFASSYAEAQHHHHSHRGRVGVYIGAPLFISPWYYHPRPYYYDPYYYSYHRPVIVQDQPVVYVEQGQAGAPDSQPPVVSPQTTQQYWYFCQDTQTYYPHVQNCATPWQRVIPHAPR